MIRAYFNPADFKRVMGAIDRLSRRSYVMNTIADPMQRRSATGFHHLLLYNLNNATSKYTYQYYARKYAAWKKLQVGYGSAGWWKLSGDLIRAVVKRKQARGKGWAVGINNIKDSGGKSWYGKTAAHPDSVGDSKKIGMYATVLEYGGDYTARGGGKHPPRPLFGPTRDEYAKEYWPQEGDRAIRNIKRRWR